MPSIEMMIKELVDTHGAISIESADEEYVVRGEFNEVIATGSGMREVIVEAWGVSAA